jgi:hypothetical protein
MRIRCACGWEFEVTDSVYQLEETCKKWYTEHIQLCEASKLHHIPTVYMNYVTHASPSLGKYNS